MSNKNVSLPNWLINVGQTFSHFDLTFLLLVSQSVATLSKSYMSPGMKYVHIFKPEYYFHFNLCIKRGQLHYKGGSLERWVGLLKRGVASPEEVLDLNQNLAH